MTSRGLHGVRGGAEAGFKAEHCGIEDLAFAGVAFGGEAEELRAVLRWFRKVILGHKGIESYSEGFCDFEQRFEARVLSACFDEANCPGG